MRTGRVGACAAALLLAWLLAACSQGNSGDRPRPATEPQVTPPQTVSADPDFYLLGPNRLRQPDGSFQIDTLEYAQAYYEAIDPQGEKDTLLGWKAANLFDSGTGTQLTVVFGDVKDLGYGRRMVARRNLDGSVAIMVDNYLVNPQDDYNYSPLNLDAAVLEDPAWHLGTSAAEYSPGPGGSGSFTKFFWFNATTGKRELSADLDGRGLKAMPSVCIGCHGGRQDPLTPPDAGGAPRFPLVPNSASMARGDPQAWFIPLDVDDFDFSTTAGFTRADQEAALKTINKMLLCTYPIPAASTLPEDACRRAAIESEWQGTAAAVIKSAYGGDGLPGAEFSDTLVPAGWSSAGQARLYRKVVARACRDCHFNRGTGKQSDIDFASFAKFQSYADRIKAHVIDRGDMPHARIIYDAFWDGDGPEVLAEFLEGEGLDVRDSQGAVLRPGRPVADPGPDRAVRQGATTLSGEGSLFSATYDWSIVSGPDGATPPTNASLTDPETVTPTFNATADGTYVLRLQTANGDTKSAPVRFRIIVDDNLTPAPSAIRFADIKAALQSIGCTACHLPGGGTPIVFTDIDRNADAVIGDATDDLWFDAELQGSINFSDLIASKLLQKPAGKHHAGGALPGFDVSAAPGQPARANYDLFLNWILNQAPH